MIHSAYHLKKKKAILTGCILPMPPHPLLCAGIMDLCGTVPAVNNAVVCFLHKPLAEPTADIVFVPASL